MFERFTLETVPLVAQRLALDAPAAVTHLAVLDDVPIGEALARCDATFAARWWHWFFMGQTEKPAERVICGDPDVWYGGDAVTEDLYGDVLVVWEPWAPDLRGHAIDSGHHMSEEAPDALAADLLAFLDGSARTRGTRPLP
jgi:hypothetical protein